MDQHGAGPHPCRHRTSATRRAGEPVPRDGSGPRAAADVADVRRWTDEPRRVAAGRLGEPPGSDRWPWSQRSGRSQPTTGRAARPRGDRGAPPCPIDAPGDLLHLQPGPVRRSGKGVRRRRGQTDRWGRTRRDSQDHRCTPRRDRRSRPQRARLRVVRRTARRGCRRASRRHGAPDEGGRRGVLHQRPRQGRLRHRDPGGRHQHAGADGRDREAHQVHRRTPSAVDPRRVHPADRPCGPTRHRRSRQRGRAVVAVGAIRRGRRTRGQHVVPPSICLPPDVQHGGEPHPYVHERAGPSSAQPVVRPVPGRSGHREAGGATRTPADQVRRAATRTRSASTATSTSTAARNRTHPIGGPPSGAVRPPRSTRQSARSVPARSST